MGLRHCAAGGRGAQAGGKAVGSGLALAAMGRRGAAPSAAAAPPAAKWTATPVQPPPPHSHLEGHHVGARRQLRPHLCRSVAREHAAGGQEGGSWGGGGGRAGERRRWAPGEPRSPCLAAWPNPRPRAGRPAPPAARTAAAAQSRSLCLQGSSGRALRPPWPPRGAPARWRRSTWRPPPPGGGVGWVGWRGVGWVQKGAGKGL